MEGWELDPVALRQLGLHLGRRLWGRIGPWVRLGVRPLQPALLPGVAVFAGLLAAAALHLAFWARSPRLPGPGILILASVGLLAVSLLGVALLRPIPGIRRYWPLPAACVWLAALACVLPSLLVHPVAVLVVLGMAAVASEWIRQQLSSRETRGWLVSAVGGLPPLLRRAADHLDHRVPHPDSFAHSSGHIAIDPARVDRGDCERRSPIGELGSCDRNWRGTTSPTSMAGQSGSPPPPNSPSQCLAPESVGSHPNPGRLVNGGAAEVETLSLRRVCEPTGAERVWGSLRVEFGEGQSHAVVHLPFSPLLRGTPQVSARIAEGTPARVRTCVAYPYGVRLELKRTDGGRLPLGIRVEVEAQVEASPSRAA